MERVLDSSLDQFIEFATFSPSGLTYPTDSLIAPLVQVVQSTGRVTLSSCEGHFDGGFTGSAQPFPFVSYLGSILPVKLEPWFTERKFDDVWSLRTPMAKDFDELAFYQKSITTVVKLIHTL